MCVYIPFPTFHFIFLSLGLVEPGVRLPGDGYMGNFPGRLSLHGLQCIALRAMVVELWEGFEAKGLGRCL